MELVIVLAVPVTALVIAFLFHRGSGVVRAKVCPVDAGGGNTPGRCVLCSSPLSTDLVTSDEIVRRVERRIIADVQDVRRLLARPPSGEWANVFRERGEER